MNKEQYIQELSSRLQGLRQEEIDDAVSYCEEYFDDAGVENEQQVIDDLGTPAKLAAQIKADAAVRQSQGNPYRREGKRQQKSSLKNILMIIGGIAALPIAVPLLLAVIALVFALVVTLGALVVAAFATVFAVLFCGIPLIFNGFMIFSHPGNAFVAIGGGLLCVGIAMLCILGISFLMKRLIPAFTRAISHMYHKAKEGNHNEKA